MKVNKLKSLGRKGQVLNVPKELIFGLAGIVVGLIFVFIFINQLFTAAPVPTSGAEFLALNATRTNFSVATISFAAQFPTIATFAVLVLIVILIALAWGYFKRSDMSGTGAGSY